MKKFRVDFIFAALVLTLVLMVACARKVEEAPKEDDFLKIPEYKTEEPVSTYTPPTSYTPIYQTNPSTATPTYWYVTFEEVQKDTNGKWDGSIDWHRAIVLNTPYFDFMEARKALPAEVVGECYFDFIVQITKEGYDSYMRYRVDYFKN